MQLNDVAITGVGAVTSVGIGVGELENSLFLGNSNIRHHNDGEVPEGASIKVAGLLPEFDFNSRLMPVEKLSDSFRSKLHGLQLKYGCSLNATLYAVIEAWSGANLFEYQDKCPRVAIIIAGNNLTQQVSFNTREEYKNDLAFVSPRYALEFMDTFFLGIISELLSVKAEGHTLGGAQASGNLAIIQAQRLLQSNIMDLCLIVGPLSGLSVLEWNSYANLGAMGGHSFINNPEKASRPFDNNAEGFIFGEGAGAIVLEQGPHALARKQRTYGYVSGSCTRLAGVHSTSPSIETEIQVMRGAIESADLSISDVQYLNTHGSSTPLGDKAEACAIEKVFSNSLPDIWVNSSKGIIGHCLCSAGIIEAIATLLQLQRNTIHSNVNLENPISQEISFTKTNIKQNNLNVALSNSFGFDGINSSVLFTKEEV